MKQENEFYLRDTRSDVGNTCMFWKKNGCGYGTSLEGAEIFTHEEAQKYADRKDHFIPLSKARVDQVTTVRVDMQLLKLDCDFSEGMIVHRYPGQYDGNDIFFDDGEGGYTADYGKAKVYDAMSSIIALQNQRGAILSKKFLDTICRPTLQAGNVNHRIMMTSAGIKYRAPRYRRPTMGKTRGNCPECGKITWSYNPYESDYCNDHEHFYQRKYG